MSSISSVTFRACRFDAQVPEVAPRAASSHDRRRAADLRGATPRSRLRRPVQRSSYPNAAPDSTTTCSPERSCTWPAGLDCAGRLAGLAPDRQIRPFPRRCPPTLRWNPRPAPAWEPPLLWPETVHSCAAGERLRALPRADRRGVRGRRPAPRGDGKTGRRRPAAVAPSAAQERFQFPATRPTGTMDDKRDEAGAAGYRLAGTSGGETASGVGRRSW